MGQSILFMGNSMLDCRLGILPSSSAAAAKCGNSHRTWSRSKQSRRGPSDRRIRATILVFFTTLLASIVVLAPREVQNFGSDFAVKISRILCSSRPADSRIR
eukprot:scaffold1519_cov166-Amphora_coffeaeformis.AAC.6